MGTYLKLIFVSWLLISSTSTYAASIVATVVDTSGKPVADAVISLMPRNGKHLLPRKEVQGAKMDQWQKQYDPYVLPIRVGTEVGFPNKDNIKHHVYSFSATKKFELKLYSDFDASPVMFDRSGAVVLGCNIHDWMLGFIYVLETPYFAKTDELGRVLIESLPGDDYVVSVWHPRLRGKSEKHDQQESLHGQVVVAVDFVIKLKRERRRKHPPGFESEEY